MEAAGKVIFDLILIYPHHIGRWHSTGNCLVDVDMYILKRFQVINCVSPAAPQAECWPSVLSIRAPHECPLVHHYSGNVYKQTEAAG